MRVAIAAGLLALLAACVPVRPVSAPPDELDAIETALAAHISVLASDEFEGRRPGTEGETRTLRYLVREWQAAGLESGTNDPSNPWFAPVELRAAGLALGEVTLTGRDGQLSLPAGSVAVFSSERRDLIDSAPLIFVDRSGEVDPLELAGRVAVFDLAATSEFARAERLAASDAAAVLVLAERYEFDELVAARRSGVYRLASQDRALAPIVVADREALFALPIGAPLRDLVGEGSSEQRPPAPVPLSLSLDTRSQFTEIRTHNLIARLPGRNPDAGAVLLLAHWDHFGICGEEGEADRICNGAVDNASGLAVLTELARMLAAGPPLERDIYFLATTAEEWGLLGTYAFTREPPIPLETIVAAFNLDTTALAPRGAPVAIVGEGLVPIDREIARFVEAQGRRIEGREIARNYVRRQDGWALLQADVPTLMVSSSFADAELLERFQRERYHNARDEIDGMELGGAAHDLLLHLALVRHFADPAAWPGGGE